MKALWAGSSQAETRGGAHQEQASLVAVSSADNEIAIQEFQTGNQARRHTVMPQASPIDEPENLIAYE